MADIPLNYFLRKSVSFSNTLSAVYTAPFDRAAIVLAGYVTNTTSNDYSIQVGISGVGNPASFIPRKPYFDVVGPDFLIPANDTCNIAPQKLVLQEFDCLLIKTTTTPASSLKFNLSILETINQTS